MELCLSPAWKDNPLLRKHNLLFKHDPDILSPPFGQGINDIQLHGIGGVVIEDKFATPSGALISFLIEISL
ncbi:MAG: hypothetical protein V3V48_12870 [Candidatus Aminicenantaceae bacterium]|jgi:hypothetical protein